VTLVADHEAALADAAPRIFWLDRPDAPAPAPSLTGEQRADLVIVGGGFTGLWAAIQAKEEDPGRDVALLEAQTVAFGASGRNGGFLDASLTHGLDNGIAHFPGEVAKLQALGRANFVALQQTLERHAIDADWQATGTLSVATEPYQVEHLREYTETLRRHGETADLLDRDAVRAELDSPTYLAGTWHRDNEAIVDPARLAWGLRRVALELGVRLHEQTPVTGVRRDGAGVRVETAGGCVCARRALLATSAYPPLVRAVGRYVAPVYDYTLVTEPLTDEQLGRIGWDNRQGVADSGNRFHYYRLTADDRILWGGYEAVYRFGGDVGPHRDQRPETYRVLAANFFRTFPQLADVRFTHRWGGAIDTCSRFSVFFGTAHRGRVAYAAGYTGLGVGASRFGARVALDLVGDAPTELTRLELVRSKPIPFPPEPLRWAAIGLTTRALVRADRDGGRRGPWLRFLDRIGAGFDS